MRSTRHFLAGAALATLGLLPLGAAQAQTPYNFSTSSNTYTENFSTIAVDASNLWSSLATGTTAIPFTGLGTGATPASRFGRVATSAATGSITTLTVGPTTISTNAVFTTTTSGGVQKVTAPTVTPVGVTLPAIALLATGTGNAVAMDQFLNFTSRNAGTLTFNWGELNNSTGDRGGTLQVYTSTDGITFTQLGGDMVIVNNVASGSTFSQPLPSAFNSSTTARIRYYYHSVATVANVGGGVAGGSRPAMAIDNIVITATALGGTPAFAAAASATTTATTKTVASTGASVSFSGSNLTSGITASTTAPFALSLTSGGTYSTSVVIPQALTGSLFVRISSATAGDFTGAISYTGGGVVAAIANTTLSGKVLATEPTAQPTLSSSNITFNTVDLTVTGGTAQKYLIVGKTGTAATYISTQIPTDAVAYTASTVFGSGTGVGTAGNFTLNSSATTTITVTNLVANTAYSFAVFAYNDDATTAVQNYLTSGFPTTSPSNANKIDVTTQAPPPNAYLWVGAANGLYSVATNWLSQTGSAIGAGFTRTAPAAGDELRFGNGASSVNADVSETIGAITLAATADVTLTVSAARTITINNGIAAGDDFTVPAGATLRLRTTTIGTGLALVFGTSQGTVSGIIDVNGTTGLPDITSNASISGTTINYASGSFFRQGALTTGSVVGSGNFQNGSTLEIKGGNTPGASTTFAATSTLIWDQNSTLGQANRTYGNLLIKQSAGTGSGAGTLTIGGDITLQGTGAITLGVTGGITVAGNVSGTTGTTFGIIGNASLNGATATFAVDNLTLGGTSSINRTATATPITANAVSVTGVTTLNSDLVVATSVSVANNALTIGAGKTLTLLSTPTKTAYIIPTAITDPAVINGTVVAQRAVSASSPFQGKGYRHYSSPVSGATVAGLATGSFTPIVDAAYPNPVVPYDALTFPNVFAYNPVVVPAAATFASFSNGYVMPGATLAVGQGYSVNKDNSTVAFTGTATTGLQTLTLTGDGSTGIFNGWNLKGNPYASGVDWTKATFAGNVQTTVSVWRPTSLNGGFYTPIANAGANQTLALGQAFFIRKTDGAAASASLTNAARVAGATTLFQRNAVPTEVAGLTLRIANTTAPDVAPFVLVRFQEGASADYEPATDGLTPGRSTGEVPTLLTVIGGGEANVNTLPGLQANGTVLLPLVVATTVDGTYTIGADELTNLPANARVELLDAKLNRTHNLQSGAYTFTSTADYAGQRFTLRVTTANGVLGLTNDLSASALTLYPNPATGLVRISAPANATVRVFDALGRTVRTLAVNQAGAELNVSLEGLTPGLYTVRAAGASQQLVVQ